MKEGFYISAYVCIDGLQNIEDVKLRHDQAIALWQYQDQELSLIRYWELERISGLKHHSKSLFSKEKFYDLLAYLLKEVNIELSDIEEIYGTKGLEKDCNYRRQFDNYNLAFHSIAHLMTCLFYGNPTPFKSQIFAMALDAGPDSQFEENAYKKNYYAACVIKDQNINFFPVESPARLWSYSRKKFKLQEGSLMALASACDTYCNIPEANFQKWLKYKFFDETARLNSQILVEDICKFVEERFSKLKVDNKFSEEENKISAIMKIINLLSVKILERNIDYAIERFNINPETTIIALSGGFALNCPTNSKILNKYKFYNYQIPPCTDDSGIALGIGISVFYEQLKNEKIKLFIDSPYYGYSIRDEISQLDKKSKVIKSIREVELSYFVDLIEKDNIIIWINENSEMGPRALGNRSLISSANSLQMKDTLNRIKQREWWRPVAPLVLDEYGGEYFKKYRESYNMLLNFKVKESRISKIPAVVHLDNSARVQSVSKKSNPKLYLLLKEYYNKTKIPILCNTSLNDKGEPIINTLSEAISFALNKGLKFICVNGEILLELHVQSKVTERSYLRNQEYFHIFDPKIKEDIKKLNPYNLNRNELTMYYDNPDIFSQFSLDNINDVKYIKKLTKSYEKKYKNGLER